jgi:uncharacterized protein with von Willebrand factor type A (vWA) domain
MESEMRALEARLRRARNWDGAGFDSDLLDGVREALLLPEIAEAPARKVGVLARLKAAFARFLDWLLGLFGRKSRRPVPAPVKGRQITLAALAIDGRTMAPSDLGEAIARLAPEDRSTLRSGVEKTVQRKEAELREEAEAKRRAAERERAQLEAERDEAKRRGEAAADKEVRSKVHDQLTQELKDRGLVTERNGEIAVTYTLIERFARLLLEEERRSLPGSVQMSRRGGGATGIYEKSRLRQPEEVAHLDIVSSMIASRLVGSKHLDESTSLVFREVMSERVHVVLALDKSGSMDEAGKLTAAKKALLALYTAVRQRYRDATVDVLAFDNDVRALDLLELWECRPGSFTNTGEALHAAHLLLRSSRATRKEVFLVTDGLPESFTDRDGQVRSGLPEEALDSALLRAHELATVTPLAFTMILLKSPHPEYEVAARQITRVLGGELIVTDPSHLGFELLVRWAGGRETARAPEPSPAGTLPPVPAARKKGRRDRRMGG